MNRGMIVFVGLVVALVLLAALADLRRLAQKRQKLAQQDAEDVGTVPPAEEVQPCVHEWKWTYESSYHRCRKCGLQEKHLLDVNMDARGYGHGCSRCGYFVQD